MIQILVPQELKPLAKGRTNNFLGVSHFAAIAAWKIRRIFFTKMISLEVFNISIGFGD
jgi:hypothetical protein